MILRKPTKTTLKMEDDLSEYENLKEQISKSKRSDNKMKFRPSAFITPGSMKI